MVLLNRLLLIYDQTARGLAAKQEVVLTMTGSTKREKCAASFESYHEKLEEEHVFPRFEKARKLTDLVSVLRKQHIAGREVTAQLGAAIKKTDNAALVSALSFISPRMYRPAMKRVRTQYCFQPSSRLFRLREYQELGERFEDREHDLFGKSGFEGMVEKVAEIREGILAFIDLSQFTTGCSSRNPNRQWTRSPGVVEAA